MAAGPEPIRNWIVSAPGEALAALMASRSVQVTGSHRPLSASPAEATVKTAALAAAGIERQRARRRQSGAGGIGRFLFMVPPIEKEKSHFPADPANAWDEPIWIRISLRPTGRTRALNRRKRGGSGVRAALLDHRHEQGPVDRLPQVGRDAQPSRFLF